MAGVFDVHFVTAPIGAFSGATERPLIKVADQGGGITVLEGWVSGTAAGTIVGGKIVTMTDAGTPAINGTVGTFAGTVVTANGVPFELTVSSGFVDSAYWIGYDQASGTVAEGTFIQLSYIMGR